MKNIHRTVMGLIMFASTNLVGENEGSMLLSETQTAEHLVETGPNNLAGICTPLSLDKRVEKDKIYEVIKGLNFLISILLVLIIFFKVYIICINYKKDNLFTDTSKNKIVFYNLLLLLFNLGVMGLGLLFSSNPLFLWMLLVIKYMTTNISVCGEGELYTTPTAKKKDSLEKEPVLSTTVDMDNLNKEMYYPTHLGRDIPSRRLFGNDQETLFNATVDEDPSNSRRQVFSNSSQYVSFHNSSDQEEIYEIDNKKKDSELLYNVNNINYSEDIKNDKMLLLGNNYCLVVKSWDIIFSINNIIQAVILATANNFMANYFLNIYRGKVVKKLFLCNKYVLKNYGEANLINYIINYIKGLFRKKKQTTENIKTRSRISAIFLINLFHILSSTPIVIVLYNYISNNKLKLNNFLLNQGFEKDIRDSIMQPYMNNLIEIMNQVEEQNLFSKNILLSKSSYNKVMNNIRCLSEYLAIKKIMIDIRNSNNHSTFFIEYEYLNYLNKLQRSILKSFKKLCKILDTYYKIELYSGKISSIKYRITNNTVNVSNLEKLNAAIRLKEFSDSDINKKNKGDNEIKMIDICPMSNSNCEENYFIVLKMMPVITEILNNSNYIEYNPELIIKYNEITVAIMQINFLKQTNFSNSDKLLNNIELMEYITSKKGRYIKKYMSRANWVKNFFYSNSNKRMLKKIESLDKNETETSGIMSPALIRPSPLRIHDRQASQYFNECSQEELMLSRTNNEKNYPLEEEFKECESDNLYK